MTTTDTTTTEPATVEQIVTVLRAVITDDERSEMVTIAEQLAAIHAEHAALFDRATRLLGHVQHVESGLYDVLVRLLPEAAPGDAVDGLGSFLSSLTGSYRLHSIMTDLSRDTDPDNETTMALSEGYPDVEAYRAGRNGRSAQLIAAGEPRTVTVVDKTS